VVLRARYTEEAVERARRRPGNHNQRRSAVGRELATRLANEYRDRFVHDASEEVSAVSELADLIRATPQFKEALQRIWPRLSGQELLHDLLGAPALLRAAGKGILGDDEIELLHRPRFISSEEIAWTKADAALIDEARVLVGPRRRPRPQPKPAETNVLEGVDLDAYSGDHRAAAFVRRSDSPSPSPKSSTRRSSSRTGTLWSTKPKTSHRWSCACSNGVISRAP
jgi:hypothetical protein